MGGEGKCSIFSVVDSDLCQFITIHLQKTNLASNPTSECIDFFVIRIRIKRHTKTTALTQS